MGNPRVNAEQINVNLVLSFGLWKSYLTAKPLMVVGAFLIISTRDASV